MSSLPVRFAVAAAACFAAASTPHPEKKPVATILEVSGSCQVRRGAKASKRLEDAAVSSLLNVGDEVRCSSGSVVLWTQGRRQIVVAGSPLVLGSPTVVEDDPVLQKLNRDGRTAGPRGLTGARSRRALVVGIDDYAAGVKPGAAQEGATPESRHWQSLAGAVNDARGFRDLLVDRYGFSPAEILLLTNAEATRKGILDSVDGWFLGGAEQGELRIFYYAGHGSQVFNSKSAEADKMDETLVPADGPRGAPDIRDKELARRFDRAARGGVQLTVVLDSCHSGSGTRGIQAGRARRVDPLQTDVADGEPAPDPAKDGALVLAAAQDRELAREVTDESETHGAFTLALIQALRSLPVDESLDHVFRKTRAIMQRDGRGQEPDLHGPEVRQRRSLLGAEATHGTGRTVVAVRTVQGGQSIMLQGGRAEELAVGCELVSRADRQPPVRLRVTAVTGLSTSAAELMSGRIDAVRVGDLFEIDRWVMPDRPAVTVWVPPSLPEAQWRPVARAVELLRSEHPEISFSDDPSVRPPSHTILWNGSAWSLNGPEGEVGLGRQPSAQDLKAALAGLGRSRRPEDRPVLFFQVPPSLALVQGLDIGANGHNSAVAVDAEGTNAQYVLSGRVVNGSPEFAWVQVRLSPSSIRAGTSIPLRTAWVRPDGMAARVLSDHAVKLGRIRGWLLLENARDAFFPYHVGLIRAGVTGLSPSFHSAGVVTQGEEYDVVIHADGPVPASVPRRYVYVFVVTQTGESQLVFPDPQLGGAGGENYLPAASGGAVPRQINLGTRIRISPPYGTDTYIMLATDEPLVNPGVLQFSGVSTTLRGASSPLVRLIANAGRPTRGVERVSVPTDWSIDRASFMSQARPAAGAPPAKWGQ